MPSTAVDYDPFKKTEVTSTPVEGDPFVTSKVTATPVESDPFKAPTMGAAYGKAVGESIIPTAGGLAGAGITMAAGAPLIAGATAINPIAGAAVGIGLGLSGAIPGSYAASKIQDLVKNLVPEETLKEYGLDPQTRAAEIKAFPIASQLGELTPSLAAFRPGRVSKLERGVGAGIGLGLEAGQQALEGEFDPTRLAIATGWQAGAPKLTRLGEKLFPTPPARPADARKPSDISVKQEYDVRNEDRFVRDMQLSTDPKYRLRETAFLDKETGEIIPSGKGHDELLKKDPRLEQGFLTEDGTFVNRKDAQTIAESQHSDLLKKAVDSKEGLHSTDFGPDRMDIFKEPRETKPSSEPRPVVDPTRYDPRKVTDEADLRAKGRELILSEGEEAARKFYRGYEEYKQTWLNPVKEVETFVGLNINNKMAMDRTVAVTAGEFESSAPKDVREKVAEAIDTGQTEKLTGSERELADKYIAKMNDIGQRALDAGVIKGLLENYVTHIVDWSKKPKGALETFLNELMGKVEGRKDTGMSPTSRYAERRSYATFEDLQQALKDSNLELRTKDLAEIYKEYATAMERAIENKKLIEKILTLRNVAGESLVRKITDTEPLPYGWQLLNSPQFPGYAVHPDLMPALKFAFEARGNEFINAAYMASQAVKRINVLGSFFHAKSLMEVLSSTNIPIWTPIKEAVVLPLVEKGIKATTGKDVELSGITKAVEAFRKGGVGDSVDQWIKSGLVLEIPQDATTGVFTIIGKASDSVISKFGPQTRILENSLSAVEKYTLGLFDKFTWDYLHTGGKLYIADKYLERARIDAEKAGKPFDEAASRQEITRFINKSFGGLNWFDLARESSTKFGKQISMAAYSPQGRKSMQLLLFAPDWTISTIKAFTAALPSGLNPTKWHPVAGAKALRAPSTQADYARLYQLKTALTYLTLLNAFNMATANRPIWENKDPTRIEYPDGTSMQAMKHAMEPYHWLAAPDQTLINKLGFLPKAVLIGLTGLEYPSPFAPKMADPSLVNRLKAIGSQALPFQISAAKGAPEGEGLKRAVLGTLGFPLYGTTPEERRRANAERNRIIREKRKEYKQRAREKGWE
jgi:hypothetical protein